MSSRYPYWVSWCGMEAIRRCTTADINSAVSLTPGETATDCWLEIEGDAAFADDLRRQLASAFAEVKRTVEVMPKERREDHLSTAGTGLLPVHESMSVALLAERGE